RHVRGRTPIAGGGAMPHTKAAAIATLIVAGAALASALAIRVPSAPQAPSGSTARDYPVQPVPFTAVHLDDEFWAPRIETNRTETIPFAFRQCELSGRVD